MFSFSVDFSYQCRVRQTVWSRTSCYHRDSCPCCYQTSTTFLWLQSHFCKVRRFPQVLPDYSSEHGVATEAITIWISCYRTGWYSLGDAGAIPTFVSSGQRSVRSGVVSIYITRLSPVKITDENTMVTFRRPRVYLWWIGCLGDTFM